MQNNSELLYLKNILSSIPSNIYWMDKNNVFLGCNAEHARVIGLSNEQEIVGKSYYDLMPKKYADAAVAANNEIMKSGQAKIFEELAILSDGKETIFLSHKAPMYDQNKNIIGIIGNSINITPKDNACQPHRNHFLSLVPKIFGGPNEYNTIGEYVLAIKDCYENMLAQMPGHVYWEDKNGIILGCNNFQVADSGLHDREEAVGKTIFDFLPKEQALIHRKNNQLVLETGEPQVFEEISTHVDGTTVVYISQKIPIKDKKGKIAGILGISIDITDRKEKERLQIENEVQKIELLEAKLEAQEAKVKVAAQVSHDIRTPLMTLDIAVRSCASKLSETERMSLRYAHTSIGDIVDNLLSQYSPSEQEEYEKKEARQPVLVSLCLLQALAEKRLQHKNSSIKFEHDFSKGNKFAFIKSEPTAFKRMLSNIINNAVDAFEGKAGTVNLKLITDEEQVTVVIQDNGKGIPVKVLNKIRDNIAVTNDKKGGHGIGLTQVRETLQRNDGEITIRSKVGEGTEMILTFPIIASPDWIAEELCVHSGDTVVILDDDSSIHAAWDIHFKDCADSVTLKHFTLGSEAISFINAGDKSKMFLLADFELIKQKMNGLDVIKQTQLQRSILVTSHFNDLKVRDLARETNTKILPKQLAPEVPIQIIGQSGNAKVVKADGKKKVDVVIIEDCSCLTDMAKMLLGQRGKVVEVFHSGNAFLRSFARFGSTRYDENTVFCLDYSFEAEDDATGVDIAEKLHHAGYTKFFLFTGWDRDYFKDKGVEFPYYLPVFYKLSYDTDIMEIFASFE